MSDLVAIAYEDLATATQAADTLVTLQTSHEIELDVLVIVERRQDGKVKLHQPSMVGLGAARGALWGGLIGMIFLVPFFGMALGAATGAATAAAAAHGVSDNFMQDVGAELGPGTAALFMLVRTVSLDKVLPKITLPGKVIQTSLVDQTEEQLANTVAAAGAA